MLISSAMPNSPSCGIRGAPRLRRGGPSAGGLGGRPEPPNYNGRVYLPRPWSAGQHVNRATMDRELPGPVAVDLEDLVHEMWHLDLEVPRPLRGGAGLLEADPEQPR